MNVTEKALKELGMFKDLEPFHEAQYIKDLRFFIEFEILRHLTVRNTFSYYVLCKAYTSSGRPPYMQDE